MKIYLKKVNIGSYYDVTDEIGDFNIKAQLKSGKSIEIFDYEYYDLRNFEKKEVDCLIGIGIKKNIIFKSKNDLDLSDPSIIFGKFIKKYQVPSKWENYRAQNEISALENDDGTFLFDFNSIKSVVTKDDKTFGLKVIRYNLLDYIYNEK